MTVYIPVHTIEEFQKYKYTENIKILFQPPPGHSWREYYGDKWLPLDFNDPCINTWDTIFITNFRGFFMDLKYFDQPLDNLKTDYATDISFMFANTKFNHPLNHLVTTNVRNASNTFANSIYNHPLNMWIANNFRNTSYMFYNAKFNQDISMWSLDNLLNASYMFQFSDFNQCLDAWCLPNIRNITYIFHCSSFYNGYNIDSIVYNKVISMWYYKSTVPKMLSEWNTKYLTRYKGAFGNTGITRHNIDWNVDDYNDLFSL